MVDHGTLAEVRLTNNSADDRMPVWSPDGRQIAFTSDRSGAYEVYIMNADGSGQRRLTHNGVWRWGEGLSWSPDGSKIAFTCQGEVYAINADGTGQTNLTSNPAWDEEPSWSPDGHQIAFTSYRSGTFEIYVMNADGTGQRQVTVGEGRHAAWQPQR